MSLNVNKKILFVTFTKSHYIMAVKILEELREAGVTVTSKIFCSAFLHDQKEEFCRHAIDQFDESTFIDDFVFIRNRLQTWKLRSLIRQVGNEFDEFSPDAIITFSENGCIYQNSYSRYKGKTDIILFHEGYGDYSDPISKFREVAPYYYIKMCLWPYKFIPITRSYTGYYNYSFLLEPNIVQRPFEFEAIKIPNDFIKSIYYSKEIMSEIIDEDSVFVCLSGKDWSNDKGLREYLCYLFDCFSMLSNSIYIKLAPNVSVEGYGFLLENKKVTVLGNQDLTSESYCFHPNFKYIVTDESSAVVNAIYSGINKTYFFLNEEIQSKGCYQYDNNDLIKLLVSKKQIMQTDALNMVQLINSNYCNGVSASDSKYASVGESIKGIICD